MRIRPRLSWHTNKSGISALESALLISTAGLLLLVSGIAYQGHSLLDSFRVPARALAFVALGMAVFVLVNARQIVVTGQLKQRTLHLLLFVSAIQIASSAWAIRPEGSTYSPMKHLCNRLLIF